MMRAALIALAAACAAAAGAGADEARDVSGLWRAEQINSRLSTPNYFNADLRERDGRLTGHGVINLCAGCRGWGQHEIEWEGRIVGDRVELNGVHTDAPFENPVRFEGALDADGQRISGTLTQGRRQSEFVMWRGSAAADGGEERASR